MAQSREQLTMDVNNTKSENSIFKRPNRFGLTKKRFFLGLLALTLVALVVAIIAYNVTSSGDSDNLRLPKSLKPDYYSLKLIPIINEKDNFPLLGTVAIHMNCSEITDVITIHIKNITINETSVKVHEIGKQHLHQSNITEESYVDQLTVKEQTYEADKDFYRIHVNRAMKPGRFYRVEMSFEGVLADDLAGFYRSSYKDDDKTTWLAVTQFQPTDARRAFPCFDEPEMKAVFEVSIGRKKEMKSLSNMDKKYSEEMTDRKGWEWDVYRPSVRMSTYLVAFMVSDFESLENEDSNSGIKFNVWSRISAKSQAEYARQIGPKILNHFEDYYGVKFPLPKMDMVALPDFNAGAMENWGLITYRETAMLYDKNESSDVNKMRIATVISHELAHQWFGNLVTPKWWNGLWLNEGFASYVEYLGVNKVEPEWKMMENFVVDELQRVFSLDALESSHPISVPVSNPDEINEIFDSISYSKGATIIRMMEHFLTQENFKTGLTNYLKKWSFGNTEQEDLWDALEKVAKNNGEFQGLSVKEIMDSWTLKKGFPVIKVVRDYDNQSATFTQEKFKLVADEKTPSDDYKWWVPISYTQKTDADFNSTSPKFWISEKEKSKSYNVEVAKSDWMIVNIQETGYYRVNYDNENWELIYQQLKEDHTKINVINRAQILDDVFNLAKASLLDYQTAFKMTDYLKDEKEYLPWESFFNALSYISVSLSKTDSFGIFKKYVKSLVHPQYMKMPLKETDEDEPLPKKFHKINIARWACFAGVEECTSHSKEMFKGYKETNTNEIHPNVRSIVYCNAIKHGGSEEWDFLWKKYEESNVAAEKSKILQALSCSKEVWILLRYLNMTLTPDGTIRKQDGPTVIKSVASKEIGNYLAFNFVRNEWEKMKSHFNSGFFALGRIISSLALRLSSDFELNELINFREDHNDQLGAARRAVDQAIERVRANIKWSKDNYITISEWLKEKTQQSEDPGEF